MSIDLPISFFTAAQYNQSNTTVVAVSAGDQYVVTGSHAGGVRVDWPSATQVDIIVAETLGQQKVQITAVGKQQS
jgi:hypothetical protein